MASIYKERIERIDDLINLYELANPNYDTKNVCIKQYLSYLFMNIDDLNYRDLMAALNREVTEIRRLSELASKRIKTDHRVLMWAKNYVDELVRMPQSDYEHTDRLEEWHEEQIAIGTKACLPVKTKGKKRKPKPQVAEVQKQERKIMALQISLVKAALTSLEVRTTTASSYDWEMASRICLNVLDQLHECHSAAGDKANASMYLEARPNLKKLTRERFNRLRDIYKVNNDSVTG